LYTTSCCPAPTDVTINTVTATQAKPFVTGEFVVNSTQYAGVINFQVMVENDEGVDVTPEDYYRIRVWFIDEGGAPGDVVTYTPFSTPNINDLELVTDATGAATLSVASTSDLTLEVYASVGAYIMSTPITVEFPSA